MIKKAEERIKKKKEQDEKQKEENKKEKSKTPSKMQLSKKKESKQIYNTQAAAIAVQDNMPTINFIGKKKSKVVKDEPSSNQTIQSNYTYSFNASVL